MQINAQQRHRRVWPFLLSLILFSAGTRSQERLMYHDIKTDGTGSIVPWSHQEPGKAWSHVINLVWNFWDTMRTDPNGIPYYMNHQVWRPNTNDPRGLGGDQINMALSSWRLLYAFTGEEKIRENMCFMADYYLTHGLSPANAAWPNIPYPYNTMIYSGIYDGDMVIGRDFTQPDKAGTFGSELVTMYKMFSRERFPNKTNDRYLEAAIAIANTLAKHCRAGDNDNSPLPFKVNAISGEVGTIRAEQGSAKEFLLSSYTSNWSGTLELFLGLTQLRVGDTVAYKKAFDLILDWMKNVPLKNNRWGPFFEDIPGWSDTQINAVTFAQFMMNHHEYFPDWKKQVRGIFDWVYQNLGNDQWKKYGVIVVNEQTAYRVPGNSHSSRQASAELQYMALTGDRYHYDNAIRQLNWATYMVDFDGKNRYPRDENWLTDGYGDYVRHYLRAMAAYPELAPSDEDHIVFSTGIIQAADYPSRKLHEFYTNDLGNANPTTVHVAYRAYETSGTEIIRLIQKPKEILIDQKPVNELKSGDTSTQGYSWKALDKGGLLTIRRVNGTRVIVK